MPVKTRDADQKPAISWKKSLPALCWLAILLGAWLCAGPLVMPLAGQPGSAGPQTGRQQVQLLTNGSVSRGALALQASLQQVVLPGWDVHCQDLTQDDFFPLPHGQAGPQAAVLALSDSESQLDLTQLDPDLPLLVLSIGEQAAGQALFEARSGEEALYFPLVKASDRFEATVFQALDGKTRWSALVWAPWLPDGLALVSPALTGEIAAWLLGTDLAQGRESVQQLLDKARQQAAWTGFRLMTGALLLLLAPAASCLLGQTGHPVRRQSGAFIWRTGLLLWLLSLVLAVGVLFIVKQMGFLPGSLGMGSFLLAPLLQGWLTLGWRQLVLQPGAGSQTGGRGWLLGLSALVLFLPLWTGLWAIFWGQALPAQHPLVFTLLLLSGLALGPLGSGQGLVTGHGPLAGLFDWALRRASFLLVSLWLWATGQPLAGWSAAFILLLLWTDGLAAALTRWQQHKGLVSLIQSACLALGLLPLVLQLGVR